MGVTYIYVPDGTDVQGGGGGGDPPAATSLTLAINDDRNVNGADTAKQGVPFPQGVLDTSYVDSVTFEIGGSEAQSFVEWRAGEVWPDGSVKWLYTQVLVNTSTDTEATLCYASCSPTLARITEGSWRVPGDTTAANITAGDSTGHFPTRYRGHRVMMFPTDSAWLADASIFDLAELSEIIAYTGTNDLLATAIDTIVKRPRIYADLMWDSTRDAALSGVDPDPFARSAIKITTNAGATPCAQGDMTTIQNWRHVGWSSQGSYCKSWNYYDWSKSLIQYGMTRSADSVGVEFIRRGINISWGMPFWHGTYTTCYDSQINKVGYSAGFYLSYGFTGDTYFRDQIECIADWFTTGLRIENMGEGDHVEGQARIIAYTIDMTMMADQAGGTLRDWAARLDTVMVAARHGHDGSGGSWFGDGTFRNSQDPCSGGGGLPWSNFYSPLIAQALYRAHRLYPAGFTVASWSASTDTTDLQTMLDSIAVHLDINGSEWLTASESYRQFFDNNSCTPDGTWTQDTHDIGPIYYGVQPFALSLGTPNSSQLLADTLYYLAGVSRDGDSNFQSIGQWNREKLLGEVSYTIWESFGAMKRAGLIGGN